MNIEIENEEYAIELIIKKSYCKCSECGKKKNSYLIFKIGNVGYPKATMGKFCSDTCFNNFKLRWRNTTRNIQ